MSDVTLFHNPDCGTSRNTLALIRHAGMEPRVVEYLKTPLSEGEVRQLLAEMKMRSVEGVVSSPGEVAHSKPAGGACARQRVQGWVAVVCTEVRVRRPLAIICRDRMACRGTTTIRIRHSMRRRSRPVAEFKARYRKCCYGWSGWLFIPHGSSPPRERLSIRSVSGRARCAFRARSRWFRLPRVPPEWGTAAGDPRDSTR